MKKKIILIGNPVAGRGAAGRIARAVDIIKSRGFNVRLMLTGKKGDAELFSKEISKDQSEMPDTQPVPLIIAAGGDGTYNEVINGIAYTGIPMAILPLGTTNVLAKELDIPEVMEKALDIALGGKVQNICLGKITLKKHNIQDSRFNIQYSNFELRTSNSELSRYFLLMAGIGFDGEAVYGIKSRIKRYSGKGAYIWSGLKTFMLWNPDKLTFNIDNRGYEGYSAIICNAAKYAGHFKVAPDANLNEPYFHAFIMHGRKRRDLIRYVSGIIRGNHLKFSDMTYLKAEKIEINGKACIQIDGDYFGKTPATIEIVPDALKLVC
ncbi:MAG: diacylglycerol kinase family protein [Thermodesulfovibrionales bacterium]